MRYRGIARVSYRIHSFYLQKRVLILAAIIIVRNNCTDERDAQMAKCARLELRHILFRDRVKSRIRTRIWEKKTFGRYLYYNVFAHAIKFDDNNNNNNRTE